MRLTAGNTLSSLLNLDQAKLAERKRLDEEARLRRLAQNASVRRIYQSQAPPLDSSRFRIPHQKFLPEPVQPKPKSHEHRITTLENNFIDLQNAVEDLKEEMRSSLAHKTERSRRESAHISSKINGLYELVEELTKSMTKTINKNSGIITRNESCELCKKASLHHGHKELGSGDSVLTGSLATTCPHTLMSSQATPAPNSGDHARFASPPVITIIVDSVSLRMNCGIFASRSSRYDHALLVTMSFLGMGPDGNDMDCQPGILFDRPRRPDEVVSVNNYVDFTFSSRKELIARIKRSLSEKREPMVTFNIEHAPHPKASLDPNHVGMAKLAILRTLRTRHDPEKVIIKIHNTQTGAVVGGLMVSAKAYATLKSIEEFCQM